MALKSNAKRPPSQGLRPFSRTPPATSRCLMLPCEAPPMIEVAGEVACSNEKVGCSRDRTRLGPHGPPCGQYRAAAASPRHRCCPRAPAGWPRRAIAALSARRLPLVAAGPARRQPDPRRRASASQPVLRHWSRPAATIRPRTPSAGSWPRLRVRSRPPPQSRHQRRPASGQPRPPGRFGNVIEQRVEHRDRQQRQQQAEATARQPPARRSIGWSPTPGRSRRPAAACRRRAPASSSESVAGGRGWPG